MFAAAFATAAILGAAQLGVVYGISALRLDRSFAGSENDWNIQLTWIAWFALLAVVGGASLAANQARLLTDRVGFAVRFVTSLGAGLGGLITMLPLTVYQAVNTKLAAPIHPALTMALTVCGAVVAGAVLAAFIAGNPPMTTSVAFTALGAWVLAAVSVADTVPLAGRLYLSPARLGVLDIEALQPIPRASFTLPVLAVVLGIAIAVAARMRGRGRIQVALSGATGPLLIAVAYLISGPGVIRGVPDQAAPYLGAMIAVVAGLIPTAIIAFLPIGPSRKRQVNPSA